MLYSSLASTPVLAWKKFHVVVCLKYEHIRYTYTATNWLLYVQKKMFVGIHCTVWWVYVCYCIVHTHSQYSHFTNSSLVENGTKNRTETCTHTQKPLNTIKIFFAKYAFFNILISCTKKILYVQHRGIIMLIRSTVCVIVEFESRATARSG